MRKAINENPVVQIAVIGVLVLAMGLLFVTRMGGGGEEAPAPEPVASDATGAATAGGSAPSGDSAASSGAAATAPSGSGSPTTATPGATATAGVAAPAGASAAPTGTPGATGTVTPEALVPGPGLPAPVKAAWDRGATIVLLIVRGGGRDDRLVRGSVQALSSPGIAVFVARAKQVARYSRITQGVGVNRVPALVVVRPKALSGSVPQATVSYGFRSSRGVVQAVKDALYTGKDNLPYHPG